MSEFSVSLAGGLVALIWTPIAWALSGPLLAYGFAFVAYGVALVAVLTLVLTASRPAGDESR